MGNRAVRNASPNGRSHAVLWACFAATAICSGLAGHTYSTNPELGSAYLFLAFFLTALAVLQTRQLAGLSNRLEESISHAAQAETSVQHARNRMQDLIDSISDGFVLWDKENRLTLHNPKATMAKSHAVYVGMTFEEYVMAIYPEIDPRTTGGDPDTWVKRCRQWFDDAGSSHEVMLKSGIWMLVTERHTRDGETVTIYTDITEIKRAEELRDVSERRLAHAQTLARIGIFEWDALGSDMYWSDIMYDIVGLSTDSPPLDFSQYLLLVRAESRDLVRSTFRRLLTSGGKYNQEYEILRPDGQIRAVRAEAEAVTNERGEVIRILGSVHDQTGTKRVETALRNAKETAVEASKAKSEFLANVSHELRTPLNAIIGFSEVMIQEIFGPVGSDRYRDYAGDIRQSGIHLLGVINDLLDYSKLEAGRLELHAEDISLNKIIDKCVRMMRGSAESEDVTLVANIGELDDSMFGDEQKVTQIVLNLVSNAIKFTPAAGVVTVSLKESGDGIDINVTDTGIGMSDKDIGLALAPFGQVDSALNRRHMGTGLGLPLSKSLAELHGGALRIESAPGKGTSVTVRLPRKQPAADDGPALRLVLGGQAG
jgi:PAS domain S-box-containing protein